MAQKIQLQLGNFVFGAYEVPGSINFGGEQALAVHDLIGGARVVDAVGRKDDDLSWSGLFLGLQALARARFVDSLRIQGKALPLTWSAFSYLVAIKSFHCSFERSYKLPYSIVCMVVRDNTTQIKTAPPLTFDAAILGDLNDAKALAASINDGPLSGLLNTLDSAIHAVASVAAAAQSAINSVLLPLQAVQARVATLTAAAGNTLANLKSVPGQLATSAGFLRHNASSTQLQNLYRMQGSLSRMQANLGIINKIPNATTVTVVGGTLFDLAAQYYRDPTQWTVIAQANGLTDPFINGIQTLTIPPAQANAAGGIPVH